MPLAIVFKEDKLDYITGTLTISGNGMMPDYHSNNLPSWYAYRTSITTIMIQNGVTKIGNNAFNGCSILLSIIIPTNVDIIGEYAFAGCSSLKVVTIEDSSIPLSFSYRALNESNNIETVHLGRNLNNAVYGTNSIFKNETHLSTLTIGNDVTEIGNYLFYGCTGLTKITSNPCQPPTINNCNAFEGVNKNIPIILKDCSCLGNASLPSGIYYLKLAEATVKFVKE